MSYAKWEEGSRLARRERDGVEAYIYSATRNNVPPSAEISGSENGSRTPRVTVNPYEVQERVDGTSFEVNV